ncbi:MAG: hypothetical protein J7J87_00035 [Candidatus Diapherotrites archaeon]|nr:hypothetical protein [Candidatus Diapherotrites archaeon]
MDNKGQGFSTFQLLIAAIVAIVILIILLAILRVIPGISSTGDPVQAASDKLKDASTKLSQHFKTDIVTFDKGSAMTAKAIVKSAEVGLQENQLCLSLGDYGSDTTDAWGGGVENGEENQIRYSGTASKNVRLSVLCDVGTELEGDIRTYYSGEAGLNPSWVSGCSCTSIDDICCLIALRTAAR